jgi:hypothetical protein
MDLNFFVIVHLQYWISYIILITHAELFTLLILWIDPSQHLSLLIIDDGLRIILGRGTLIERIISCRKADSVQPSELAVEEGHLTVHHGVGLSLIQLLIDESADVPLELFLLFLLSGSHRAILELLVLASEWADLGSHPRVEHEVDCSLVLRFNLARLFLGLQIELHGALDRVLFSTNLLQLLGADLILEIAGLVLVLKGLGDRVIHPILVINVQLVFKGVTPVVFIRKKLHAFFEILTQEILSDVHAL